MRPPFAWFHTATARCAFMGILVGLLFPVVATVLDLFLRGQSPTMTAFLQVQTTQPLHWIIDTTPIFLGLFAALRKHIENKLQESRETFELAVRGSSDGIWHAWINPTDYFHPRNEVYYSPRFKELVGYT